VGGQGGALTHQVEVRPGHVLVHVIQDKLALAIVLELLVGSLPSPVFCRLPALKENSR
jgi:hypothetical protein